MDDLAQRFGRLVALHRKNKGWTQERLAEEAGLSFDMIAKVETGVTGARFPTISKLAKALEVDASELFFSQVPRNAVYRGKRSEIARLLEELPDREVDWAYELFRVGLMIMHQRSAKPTRTKPSLVKRPKTTKRRE